MLIRHFSTHDIEGGAARAAFRLNTALRAAGHDSRLVVRYKKSDDDYVEQLPPLFLNPWPARFDRVRRRIPGLRPREITASYVFNFNRPPQVDMTNLLNGGGADIICLHWINGLFDVTAIRRLYERWRAPLVWVIHDLNAFSGGCHYSFGCDGYTKQCGACPQINSTDPHDPTHQTWLDKRRQWSELPFCFVALSGWCAARVKDSSLFRHARVERIALPMDTQLYRPLEQGLAREVLQLPPDKKIIFFGASYLEDERKGISYLVTALDRLAALLDAACGLKREEVFLLAAGLNGKGLMARLPFAGRYLGHVSDELMMALAYQAADVAVCPSFEDAAPMMIGESMLCGTPVVAFDADFVQELVRTGATGYRARFRDAEDLAQGIHALLHHPQPLLLRAQARSAAAAIHTPQTVARQHLALYQELIAARVVRPRPAGRQRQ